MGIKSPFREPLVSIITPTFNRAGTISRAIESVISQNLPQYEHIIIDGKSTDNTTEVVHRYSNIRFVSEPDHGIYDALNKGLRIARGKYIGWLNSDDFYTADSLLFALEELRKEDAISAVFGAARLIFEESTRQPQLIPTVQQKEILNRVAFDTFPINAFLFKREVFEQIGTFDAGYKIAADREFMFRFGLSDIPYKTLDRVLYVYCSHPTSVTLGKQSNLNIQGHLEEMQIALKNREGLTVSDGIYRLCTKWHKRASRDAALRIFRKGDRKAFISIMKQGLNENKDWLFYFAGTLLFRILGRILPKSLYDMMNKHT